MIDFSLYPAIDLKDGKCVRLLHGEMDKATVYHEDPATQAGVFEASGFTNLHIVDLDGAFSGQSENVTRVKEIIAQTKARTQLGGGIRTLTAVEGWLDAGIHRVILGTAAVENPAFVQAAAGAFPEQIVVGIDAREDRVKTAGWGTDTSFTAADIARRFEDYGVAALVFTDIGRDGALSGANVAATADLARAVSIPVIASGGVASVQDITDLRAADAPIEGVIIGRALYDGRIDPSTALRAATGDPDPC
ncbi:MAG: 1-(5-phosphoribosyl)-5-[(5-phosphoribosylamino)methylideneamino]imidazole-4-carboxamide isomerase [Pseudomonadota bacterium]